MTVPTITIGEVKKEGLGILNAIAKYGKAINLSHLKLGLTIFFIMLTTSIALLFSGPLLFIGVMIVIPLITISTLALTISPVVMAGVADEYLLYNRNDVTIKSILLGICFLISFFIIPYVGLLLLFVLFAYCFGIVCDSIRTEYQKYQAV